MNRSETLFPSRTPGFNHVALSLPSDRLDAEGRRAICDFYGEVFGWEELPTQTEDRKRLVLAAHTYEQFVYLIADDRPMACPRHDHFGLSVGSVDELHAAHDRAAAYRSRDDRVDLIAPTVEDHGVLQIHNFYVGYLLPLMVEVQHWAFPTPAREAAAAEG
jgi:hypothetical protein